MNETVANDATKSKSTYVVATLSQPPSINAAADTIQPDAVAGAGEVLPPTFDRVYSFPPEGVENRPAHHVFIFLDGTWNEERNERGHATPTNVLRMFLEMTEDNESALAATSDNKTKVIARYFRGVGSRQDNDPMNRLRFGFNGKDEERIRAAAFAEVYQHYGHAKDSIYILGFSRGAASARLLARDICIKGLPPRLRVRTTHFPNLLTGQIEARVEQVERLDENPAKSNHKPGIAFLGCWDTVDAFVLPSRFPDSGFRDKAVRMLKNLWPQLLGEERFDNDKNENLIPDEVIKAVHCVAIDETRNAFLPTLMPAAANVEEVWFPGVHGDVGGGYDNNLLAQAPYTFMKARLIGVAKDRGADAQILFKPLPEGAREKQQPAEYCFHFHGLNTDVKRVKDIFGFGTAMRTIRVETQDKSKPLPKPGLHVSTAQIMNGGAAFAADKHEKRKWSITYNPYNVRILKKAFTSVDERDDPPENNPGAVSTGDNPPADAKPDSRMDAPAGKPSQTSRPSFTL